MLSEVCVSAAALVLLFLHLAVKVFDLRLTVHVCTNVSYSLSLFVCFTCVLGVRFLIYMCLADRGSRLRDVICFMLDSNWLNYVVLRYHILW